MIHSKYLHNFDLETLHTFLVVIEQRSFSSAAEILHKTPSAISYRIKCLEDSLGVRLVDRTTHSVNPTKSGEYLLSKTHYILNWHKNIPKKLKEIEDGMEPYFNLVINNLLYDATEFSLFLHHLHERFPGTEFKIKKAVYMGVWDFMLHENGHAAIGAPSFHPIDDNYQTYPLGLIQWVMVCGLSHPLAQCKKCITIDQIKTYPVVNIEDTSSHISKRFAWRLPGQREMIVPDLDMKIQCHINGLGIGFLPSHLAYQYIDQNLLVPIQPNEDLRPPSPMSFVRKAGDDGIIGNYIETLFLEKHEWIQPFLKWIS